MYQPGDIILIPFPFTDLTAVKTRPAVIVSVSDYEKETGNLTAAMITSLPHTTLYDYELKDWKEANLMFPSWVRAKLATLDPQLICYKPGKLSKSDLKEVQKIIRLSLGL